MEKIKNEMKIFSMAMFALVIYRCYEAFEYFRAFRTMDTSALDAASQAVVPVISMVLACISMIFAGLILVLGIKGLIEANNPSSSRFHIVLARVLGVFSVIGVVGSIGDLFSSANLVYGVISLVISIVYVVCFFGYANKARDLRVVE